MTHYKLVIFLLLIASFKINAQDELWGKKVTLPGNKKCEIIDDRKVCLSDGNRKNIYNLPVETLNTSIENGSSYVLDYPVHVTEMQLPKAAMDKFFNSDSRSALRRFIFNIAKDLTNFKTFKDVFDWLGLHELPKNEEELGPNYIPQLSHLQDYPMGVSLIPNNGHTSLTFSCAACHSSNLFGKKILGMTNRFPRANEAFIMGQNLLEKTPAFMFNLIVGPSKEDYVTFKRSKEAMNYVGLKMPLTLGLDTSLAQVGLSLAKRGLDPYAIKNPSLKPRKNELENLPADSKPAVWWNLKYKTKWLSDASIVSGNPIYTNFLWNEIGRGIDLKQLESWLINNQDKIKELTSYVFHTEAPKYNDYFPNRINITKAKQGQKLFNQNCKSCHGEYEKGWNSESAHLLNYEQKIETTKVWYHTQTKVENVQTEAYRRNGMKYFYKDLNRLAISKTIGTVVKPQKGYVPPPLVGIWARWPYLHNNSIPTLYDLLTIETKRPKFYIAVPADNPKTDFDFQKNGYPAPDKIREPFKSDKDYYFNNKLKGLSNKGHTEMLLDELGNERYSQEEKYQIIEFLKTL